MKHKTSSRTFQKGAVRATRNRRDRRVHLRRRLRPRRHDGHMDPVPSSHIELCGDRSCHLAHLTTATALHPKKERCTLRSLLPLSRDSLMPLSCREVSSKTSSRTFQVKKVNERTYQPKSLYWTRCLGLLLPTGTVSGSRRNSTTRASPRTERAGGPSLSRGPMTRALASSKGLGQNDQFAAEPTEWAT